MKNDLLRLAGRHWQHLRRFGVIGMVPMTQKVGAATRTWGPC
jgi:hypothetical protein